MGDGSSRRGRIVVDPRSSDAERLTLPRRNLLSFASGLTVVWPLIVHAQQKTKPVLGILANTWDQAVWAEFPQGLSDIGFVEGQNLTIEYRLAQGHLDRFPALAAELVESKVDVIFATGPAARAAKNAT